MFDIVPASYERRGGFATKVLGRLLFRLMGWRLEGRLPDVPKIVISVAPHTSNWDFVVGVLALWGLGIRISFLAKHTLFDGMFGRWLRSLGGIAVDRSGPHGVVGDAIAAFQRCERLVLVITPEGTRRRDKGFKTGFLHIARGAQVPILLAYFDFQRKVVGFGPTMTAGEDVESDLRRAKDFYRPMHGKHAKDWQSEPSV